MYAPGSLTDEMKQVIEQVVTFLRAVTIQEDNNGVRLKPMEAGTEGGFMVEVDTFHQLLIGRAMEDAGLLLKNAKWREIGSALVQGVNINMTEDGVLLPFKNAPYTGGTQFIFALLLMPGKLDIRSIDAALEKGATPWGVNSEQTTEEYRHWPWNDTQAAICYTHERHSSLAMNWLMKQKNWCSSLGAIPEKIRLDGFAIGYWYTTTHAILQFAICEALAFADGEEIFLAYGFDDRWLDFAVDGMALPGSLILSYRIEKGKLISLCLENATTLERKMKVSLNPVFDGGILTETLIIPACGSIAVL